MQKKEYKKEKDVGYASPILLELSRLFHQVEHERS